MNTLILHICNNKLQDAVYLSFFNQWNDYIQKETLIHKKVGFKESS